MVASMKKSKPIISEFRLWKFPIERDTMTPEEIMARLAEIDDIADLPLDHEVTWALAAEVMSLEDELVRLTDPTHKHPRH